MIRAIIFDFDGTLIDSTRSGMIRHQQVAQEIGLKVPSIEQMRIHQGEQWPEVFLNSVAKEAGWSLQDLERFIQVYLTNYHALKYSAFDGAIETLAQLKKQTILLAILSTRDKKTLISKLKLAGYDLELFCYIQAKEDSRFDKSDRRVWEKCIEAIKKIKWVNYDEILAVGDTVKYDFLPAKNHIPQINFVGVTSGTATKEEFLAAGLEEKLIISSVADLPLVLKLF